MHPYGPCPCVCGIRGSTAAVLGGICCSWGAWSECLLSACTHGTACSPRCERTLPWVLSLCVVCRHTACGGARCAKGNVAHMVGRNSWECLIGALALLGSVRTQPSPLARRCWRAEPWAAGGNSTVFWRNQRNGELGFQCCQLGTVPACAGIRQLSCEEELCNPMIFLWSVLVTISPHGKATNSSETTQQAPASSAELDRAEQGWWHSGSRCLKRCLPLAHAQHCHSALVLRCSCFTSAAG